MAPIYASNNIAVDLSLGFLPYEQQAVEEAVPVECLGASFPVASAEDLIIHKAISERERDWTDIEGILGRDLHLGLAQAVWASTGATGTAGTLPDHKAAYRETGFQYGCSW